MFEHPAEVQRGIHVGISEREERGQDTSGTVTGTSHDGPAFWGDGVLGEHGGQG